MIITFLSGRLHKSTRWRSPTSPMKIEIESIHECLYFTAGAARERKSYGVRQQSYRYQRRRALR
jgi:hypothetical protein